MKKFAFISRHTPTAEQIELAAEQGIELVPVGDMDAFTVHPAYVAEKLVIAGGVVVVHPAAAMRLKQAYDIGVFENGVRPVEGGTPAFFAKALHIYPRDGLTFIPESD